MIGARGKRAGVAPTKAKRTLMGSPRKTLNSSSARASASRASLRSMVTRRRSDSARKTSIFSWVPMEKSACVRRAWNSTAAKRSSAFLRKVRLETAS